MSFSAFSSTNAIYKLYENNIHLLQSYLRIKITLFFLTL